MFDDILFFIIAIGVIFLPFTLVGLVGCIVRPDVFKF